MTETLCGMFLICIGAYIGKFYTLWRDGEWWDSDFPWEDDEPIDYDYISEREELNEAWESRK